MLRVLLTLFVSFTVQSAYACGVSTDCRIGERVYRIAIPQVVDESLVRGAVIFAHGYRGSAAGAMRNKGVIAALNKRGLAYIAAEGVRGTWDLANRPGRGSNEDGLAGEIAYFRALKNKLVREYGIAEDNIMLAGFSAGGMVTWQMACVLGNEFAAYAPIAGTFWKPVPLSCSALPVPMIHIHGTLDRTVPLKGRKIGDGAQGDVYKALDLMAKSGSYGVWRPLKPRDGLACQERGSDDGNFVQFCLHEGGHSFRSEWLGAVWDAFVAKGVLR